MIRLAVVLLLLSASSMRAQDTLPVTQCVLHDAGRIGSDALRFVSGPAHWNSGEVAIAGLCAGGTLLTLAADHAAREGALRSHSAAADDVALFGARYGEAKYGFGFAALLYGGGLLARYRPARETAIQIVESIAFAGITTTVVKSIIGRGRPYLGEGSTTFRPFQLKNDYLSMPSGHATVAFSVSSVLAARIGNPFATVGLYSAAAITAASRVYNDEHWVSDVVAGAVIGTVAGISVNRFHEADGSATVWNLSPIPGGLRAELRF